MTSVDTSKVVQNEAAGRFELGIEGQLAVLDYIRSQDTITFTHTEVPPRFRGRGYGAALAQAALEYAEAERLRVVALCSFVAAYIVENPQYRHLLAARGARLADGQADD